MLKLDGPYKISARDVSSGIGPSELFWYPEGPGHSYNGGYLGSYSNLAPLEDNPDGSGRNLPPPKWIENVIQLLNEAYHFGRADKMREIHKVLGLEKPRE